MHRIIQFVRKHPQVSFVSFTYIVLTLLICHPFGLYFLCDDWSHIPAIINGNFFQTKLLRPIANLTLWLDIQCWNVNPVGFHLTNLVLHILCSLLVASLAKTILAKYGHELSKQPLVPFFCGLLFFCYGFHSEPIFWIVGRGGTLSAFFIQLSLLLFLKEQPFYLFLSALVFIIALFTYELSWALPALMTAFSLYDYLIYKKKKGIKVVAIFWALLFSYLWFRFSFLGYRFGYGANNVLSNDFGKLLRNLSALFARLFLPPMQSGSVFFTAFLITVCLLAFLLYRILKKSTNIFAFFILLIICTVLSLLPAISAGIDTHDTESERFIYPASVFITILVVCFHELVFKNCKLKFSFLFVIIAINLFFLYNSSLSYRYASKVSRTIVETLNSVKGIKQIVFYGLPTQYQGALLFRIGFPKYAPGLLESTYDSIQIKSFAEIKNKREIKIYPRMPKTNSGKLFFQFKDSNIILY